VRHKDIAYHAGPANDWTIGIEHNTRVSSVTKDTKLTAAQYLKSAELVLWLCNMLGFAPDRYHISGHSEADPSSTHSNCPQRVLNWDLYMSALSDQQEIARGGTPMRLWNDDEI
jgi:N-acetyl-anhydromuramyl-L-alanine amidase AmpD